MSREDIDDRLHVERNRIVELERRVHMKREVLQEKINADTECAKEYTAQLKLLAQARASIDEIATARGKARAWLSNSAADLEDIMDGISKSRIMRGDDDED